MVVFLNDILHVQGLQISFPILNKFVNVELRVFNKEEEETSQRDLDTATIVGKQAIRCFDFKKRG